MTVPGTITATVFTYTHSAETVWGSATGLPSTASFIHVFNTILEAYQPHISRIKAEQPQILEKFTQMGQDMEKTQTEKRKTGFPNRWCRCN